MAHILQLRDEVDLNFQSHKLSSQIQVSNNGISSMSVSNKHDVSGERETNVPMGFSC